MAYTELLALWTGPAGLPGYSKFRFIGDLSGSQLDAAAANLRTFLEAIKARLTSQIHIQIQSGASVHDDDGTLLSERTIGTVPLETVGSGGTNFSAASGFMVLWNTGAINGGKKVRGRTYFVPAATSNFDTDGTILEANRATILAAANAFAASTPSPAVNSRARPGNPAAGNQTTAVINATVSDKQVIMRSRRD